MKKAFLKLTNGETLYEVCDGFETKHVELHYIHQALEQVEDSWVNVSIDDDTVLLWSLNSFKEPAEVDLKTPEEQEAFIAAYEEYYDKRWEDMPQVDMSLEDFQALQAKWQKITEQKPKYVVLSWSNAGFTDQVDILGKNSLTEQDLKEIKSEYEQYLKYAKAEQAYIENHLDYSEEWRSSADSEYEADILQYYKD